MHRPGSGEERLLATIALVDLALILERAGIDPRGFAPAELERLARVLVPRHRGAG